MNKKIILILIAVLTVAAIINLRFISLDNDISVMLPKNKNIRRSLDFLEDENFSGKVIIWLQLKSSDYTSADLISVSQTLAFNLEGPLIAKVTSGFNQTNFISKAVSLSKYNGQIIKPEKLPEIESKIKPNYIQDRLAAIYKQSLLPASNITMPLIRIDPLGLNSELFSRLQNLSKKLGYKISFKKGSFLTSDGKNAMIVVETPIEITDISGSHQLINHIKKKIDTLPDFVSAKIVAAHLHTISNEAVIKRDILLTATIAAIAFLLLFLFYFKDPKAIFVFILPIASIIVAISLSSFIFDKISYFIIGMGVVVAGISIDYGIHVYVALGNNQSVKKVAKPIIIGVLTTISVFAAFLFSETEGYNQLGIFSILSIVLCLLYAFFLLPVILGKAKKTNLFKISRFKGFDKISLFFWIVAIILFSFFIPQLNFDNNIKNFDGSSEEIIKIEKEFSQTWQSTKEPAIFVTESSDLEQLREKNDTIYAKAVDKIGDNFINFSSIWPSKKTREYRYHRWEEFWKEGNEAKLKNILAEKASIYDISAKAFSPFFDNLYTLEVKNGIPEEISFLKEIQKRFLFKSKDKYKMISFFPDNEKNLKKLIPLTKDDPQSFIVSRNFLGEYISEVVSQEAIFLSIIAGCFILFLTFMLLQSIKLALISLIVPLTSVMAILAISGFSSKALNASSLIAAIVVIGLSIDYGIFMVYDLHHKLKANTPLAVTLSAVTTLLGVGVLLFAQHPILLSIGRVLVTGVLCGYLTAFFVVPALFRLFYTSENVN